MADTNTNDVLKAIGEQNERLARIETKVAGIDRLDNRFDAFSEQVIENKVDIKGLKNMDTARKQSLSEIRAQNKALQEQLATMDAKFQERFSKLDRRVNYAYGFAGGLGVISLMLSVLLAIQVLAQ